MGAEDYHGIIYASSKEEAITEYARTAPIDFYNNVWYRITSVRFFDKTFTNREQATIFLKSKITKWCNYAAMCKCGDNLYAYAVLYAT